MKHVIKVIKFIYNIIVLSIIVFILIGLWYEFTRKNSNKETSSESHEEYEEKLTQSENDSVKWLLETADNGTDTEEVQQAQYDLAECYLSGTLGLPEDVSLYIKWITKSANNGYEPACYSLGLHYKKNEQI